MAEFTTDPYTQVHDKLWELLTANADFVALVRAGNRVNLQGEDPEPRRSNLQDADAPEVMLLQTGGTIDPWATGSSASLTETYRLTIATADVRPQKWLNRVKWAICRALAAGASNLGLSFVTHVSCTGATDALDDKELNRGTRGWSSVLLIRVDMHIDRTAMVSG
ncbi:MAG: hypothetical protein NTW19_02525 [Planctomycetota bacterium]|nr:hypothetical protein [Planctomycetota bacterium]